MRNTRGSHIHPRGRPPLVEVLEKRDHTQSAGRPTLPRKSWCCTANLRAGRTLAAGACSTRAVTMPHCFRDQRSGASSFARCFSPRLLQARPKESGWRLLRFNLRRGLSMPLYFDSAVVAWGEGDRKEGGRRVEGGGRMPVSETAIYPIHMAATPRIRPQLVISSRLIS